MGRLPDGAHKMVRRVCVCLICPVLSSGYCSTSHLLSPSHAVHNPVFWMGRERNGPHAQLSAQLKKPGDRSHFFTFLMGEITGWEDLCWHWAVLSTGRGDAGKVKLFALPSSMCSTSDCFFFFFFLQWCAGSFPARRLDFHKVPLVCRWLSKLVCLEKDGRKFLFCHFDDIIPRVFNVLLKDVYVVPNFSPLQIML